MGLSKASANWQGGFKTGKGSMKPAHGGEVEFSAASRFEGQPSSNPEELIGAALAGCFSMALTLDLEKAGLQPKSVQTEALVSLEKKGEGFAITRIALTTVARVPAVEVAKFQSIADLTRRNCPVAKALGAVEITLEARLDS
jgi:lipoyl-dependent peroxiredoxin